MIALFVAHLRIASSRPVFLETILISSIRPSNAPTTARAVAPAPRIIALFALVNPRESKANPKPVMSVDDANQRLSLRKSVLAEEIF